MAALTIPWRPTGRTLRQLGWVLAALLALAGHVVAPSPTALGLQFGGAVVFAIATVRPGALRPIYLLFLIILYPALRLLLRPARPYVRVGLASDLASTARRLRPRRRLPQP